MQLRWRVDMRTRPVIKKQIKKKQDSVAVMLKKIEKMHLEIMDARAEVKNLLKEAKGAVHSCEKKGK